MAYLPENRPLEKPLLLHILPHKIVEKARKNLYLQNYLFLNKIEESI